MRVMKRYVVFILIISMLFAGCSRDIASGSSASQSSDIASAETPKPSSKISDILNSQVFDQEVATLDNQVINLDEVNDNIVNITNAGNFVLTGTLKGMVRVEVNKDAQVKLTLSGARIENNGSACIYFKSGDKLIVSAAEGTENYLINTGRFVNSEGPNIDGAIFAKDDLQISGHGKILISSEYGHGIVAKDDFVAKNVSVDISCAKKGIIVNDKAEFKSGAYNIKCGSEGIEAFSVKIKDGEFNIDAGDDGINASDGSGRSFNPSAKQDGVFIDISGGIISITAGGDGIDSNGDLYISGGELTIVSFNTFGDSAIDYSGKCEITGGVQNVPEDYGMPNMTDPNFGGFIGGPGRPEGPPPETSSTGSGERPGQPGFPQGIGPGYHP